MVVLCVPWPRICIFVAQLYVGKQTKRGRDRSGVRTPDYSVNIRKLYQLSYTVVLYAPFPRVYL